MRTLLRSRFSIFLSAYEDRTNEIVILMTVYQNVEAERDVIRR